MWAGYDMTSHPFREWILAFRDRVFNYAVRCGESSAANDLPFGPVRTCALVSLHQQCARWLARRWSHNEGIPSWIGTRALFHSVFLFNNNCDANYANVYACFMSRGRACALADLTCRRNVLDNKQLRYARLSMYRIADLLHRERFIIELPSVFVWCLKKHFVMSLLWDNCTYTFVRSIVRSFVVSNYNHIQLISNTVNARCWQYRMQFNETDSPHQHISHFIRKRTLRMKLSHNSIGNSIYVLQIPNGIPST